MPKKNNIEFSINEKELAKTVERAQQNYLKNNNINCPHCKMFFAAVSGWNVCPFCRNNVEVIFD